MKQTGHIAVRQATGCDVELIAPLFDAYRQFYRQPADLGLAKQFLSERMQRGESTILLALSHDESAVGFVQMYPSFSSVAAAQIVILNDLFVASQARRMGVGTLLLGAAARVAREMGAVRIALSTEVVNGAARALYESEGWKLQTEFCVYDLALNS